MTRTLDADFVNSYASRPPQSTIDKAISLHSNVRNLLGDTDYATLLQGSYKNDTCLNDMNDVDIVVVRKDTRSQEFSSARNLKLVDWNGLFSLIEQKLQCDQRYQGKWKRGDKCIKLFTEVNIDIVPAVVVYEPTTDPIAIYSFNGKKERQNWPRTHYDKCAEKSGRTNGNFKQTVRLFKRWAKAHFGDSKIAPSYYIECLLFSLPDSSITGDLAQDFVSLGNEVLKRYPVGLRYEHHTLSSVAGKGNLLSSSEWDNYSFGCFLLTLNQSLLHAKKALLETNQLDAKKSWIAAFNGQS